MTNLAALPEHATRLSELSQALDAFLSETGDAGTGLRYVPRRTSPAADLPTCKLLNSTQPFWQELE